MQAGTQTSGLAEGKTHRHEGTQERSGRQTDGQTGRDKTARITDPDFVEKNGD